MLITCHAKRGRAGIDDAGVVGRFSGVAVHDAWAPYDTYADAERQMCCAHVLRELANVGSPLRLSDRSRSTVYKIGFGSLSTAANTASTTSTPSSCSTRATPGYPQLHNLTFTRCRAHKTGNESLLPEPPCGRRCGHETNQQEP